MGSKSKDDMQRDVFDGLWALSKVVAGLMVTRQLAREFQAEIETTEAEDMGALLDEKIGRKAVRRRLQECTVVAFDVLTDAYNEAMTLTDKEAAARLDKVERSVGKRLHGGEIPEEERQ